MNRIIIVGGKGTNADREAPLGDIKSHFIYDGAMLAVNYSGQVMFENHNNAAFTPVKTYPFNIICV